MTTTPTPNGNYQVLPSFTGTDGVAGGVYLLPPSFVYGQKSDPPITIPLMYIGGPNYQQYQYSNADFALQLSQQGAGTPSQANILVNITLTGANMWKCAASARAALMSNFVDLLQHVETNFEMQGVLVPGATFRIGQQIADALPAPLLETLFYRYSFWPGFNPGAAPAIPYAYVDVRPGMQLRVETETSQLVTPSSPLNGYVSSGRFTFLVNSVPVANGARLVTFDPFLGTIKAPSITGAATSPVVAGGLVDLEPVSGARAYWRLFYPQSMSAPSQPGDLTINNNVTLVGAQTLAQLNTATANYPQPDLTGKPPNVYTIFLGRAIAVPEIPIWISAGTLTTFQYVPVGTTIANIVERFTTVPLDPQKSGVVSVTRTTTASTGPDAKIGLTVGDLTAIPSAMFDVPLIAGDSVTLSL